MPGRKPVPPLGLGIYLPPPPSAAAVEDPIDEELRKAIRRAGGAAALARIAGGADPAAVVQHVPQPTSVQDVIALEREARETTKDARQAAMETAEAERERRVEAEQRAAGSYEAGQQEAENRWAAIVEMQNGFHGTVMGMFEKLSAQQVAAAQSDAARIAAEMKASNDATVAAMKAEIDKRDGIIATQQQHIEALKGRKTIEEVAAERLAAGDLSHPAVRAFLPQQPPAPQGESTQEQLNKGMVPIILEDEAEKRRLQREVQASEVRRNDQIGQAVAQAAPLLRSVFGGVPAPQGRPPLQAMLPGEVPAQ